jgi:hypothetical protein
MMENKISIEQADQLVDAYYEGTTTQAEEQLLRDFLNQNDLPQRFDAERAIFGYFTREKSTDTSKTLEPIQVDRSHRGLILKINPVLKWSLAAAVIFSAVLIVPKTLANRNVDVAYVDGVRLTDKNTIRSLALTSIQNMELNNNEVETSLNILKENNLIESQLEEFPSL